MTEKVSQSKKKEEIKIIDNIKKQSKEDKNEYRGIILPNNLKILLISCPDTKSSAIALNINVGYGSDPDDLPGLTDLLSRIIFNEIYDDESYLLEYPAYRSREVESDFIYFQFIARPTDLEKLIDKLINFLINPKFNDSAIEKAINEIQFLYKADLEVDFYCLRRIIYIFQEICDPTHPLHKLPHGNKKLLYDEPKSKGIDIRQRLIEFFQKNYSSELMSFCLFGKENLDQLTELCKRMSFDKIENKNLKPIQKTKKPFQKNQLKKEIKMAFDDCEDEIIINFQLDEYDKRFTRYFAQLIHSQDENGIYDILFSKNLCSRLSICYDIEDNIAIIITLTQNSFDRIDEIVGILFQYLNFLKKKESQQCIIDYLLKSYKKIIYEYALQSNTWNGMFIWSRNMDKNSNIDFENVLTYPSLDPASIANEANKINKFMNYLTTDNMILLIRSKRFFGKTDRIERYYRTEFSINDIDEKRIESWNNVGNDLSFKLPTTNLINYYEDNQDEKEEAPVEFDKESYKTNWPNWPILLRKDIFADIWYLQLTKEHCNKRTIYYGICIANPILCHNNLIAHICMRLFTNIIDELLKLSMRNPEFRYHDLDIYFQNSGLIIQLECNRHNMMIILIFILDKLVQSFDKFDLKYFDQIKNRLIYDELISPECVTCYRHTNFLFNDKLIYDKLDSFWIQENFDFDKNIELIKKELTKTNVEKISREFFSKIKIRIFGFGNLTRDDLKQVEDMVKDKLITNFNPSPITEPYEPGAKIYKLKQNSFSIFQHTYDDRSINLILNYYQFGVLNSIDEIVKNDLLVWFLKTRFSYDIKQSKEFNFLIKNLKRPNFIKLVFHLNVASLNIYIQTKLDLNYVDLCFDLLLMNSFDYLKNLSDEEFENEKEYFSIRNDSSFNYIDCSSRFKRIWFFLNSIEDETDSDFEFDVSKGLFYFSLNKITKQDLLNLFDEKLIKQRRKLSVRIVGNKTSNKNDESIQLDITKTKEKLKNFGIQQQAYQIEDINKFRQKLQFY